MVQVRRTPPPLPLGNSAVAGRLDVIAERLEKPEANPHRVRAYRAAAETVRGMSRPVADLLSEAGRAGLEQLPGVGKRLAEVIEQLTLTGHAAAVGEGFDGPEALFTSVSGIGPELAARVVEKLGLTTLEELERAAHDGRLSRVPGFGAKRVRGVQDALAGRFRRSKGPGAEAPPVADVLAVDAEYRDRSAGGQLRRIAPRRFNPTGEAWLPVMSTQRGGRRYRALYSNTPLAHRLGREHDWVVVFFSGRGASGQCTVVTAKTGPLAGRRVVRGREVECARHYQAPPAGGEAARPGPAGAGIAEH